MSESKKKTHHYNGRRNNSGFTIVELMIATVVFSLVLMICSYAIVHIGRVYYKGAVSNKTQDISRKLINDVVYSIQFGSGYDLIVEPPVTQTNASGRNFTAQAYCLGKFRYTYTTELSLGDGPDQSKHVLWKNRDNDSDCAVINLAQEITPDSDLIGEILDTNMRIPIFNITPPDVSTSGMWEVEVTVSYGDEADFEFKDPGDESLGRDYTLCKGFNAGGQFCAVSTHKTNVQKRL